jgi:hypothetical protein
MTIIASIALLSLAAGEPREESKMDESKRDSENAHHPSGALVKKPADDRRCGCRKPIG